MTIRFNVAYMAHPPQWAGFLQAITSRQPEYLEWYYAINHILHWPCKHWQQRCNVCYSNRFVFERLLSKSNNMYFSIQESIWFIRNLLPPWMFLVCLDLHQVCCKSILRIAYCDLVPIDTPIILRVSSSAHEQSWDCLSANLHTHIHT